MICIGLFGFSNNRWLKLFASSSRVKGNSSSATAFSCPRGDDADAPMIPESRPPGSGSQSGWHGPLAHSPAELSPSVRLAGQRICILRRFVWILRELVCQRRLSSSLPHRVGRIRWRRSLSRRRRCARRSGGTVWTSRVYFLFSFSIVGTDHCVQY